MARDKTSQSIPGAGLLESSRDGNFPSSLIKANADFFSALANSSIRDEGQRNDIIDYSAQLRMFEMVEELEDLTNFLNASLSINMASRAQAAQAHSMIWFPQTSGMRLSKDEIKAYSEANITASSRRKNRENNDGDKEAAD